jgi:fucose permease
VTDTLRGERSGRRITVWCAAIIFLAFALPSSMLGVMWPDVRERFDQSLGALGLVVLTYGVGRLSMATSGRTIVVRFGTGRSFIAALAGLGGVCALLASATSWPMFLVAVGALGAVAGCLDSIGATFIAGQASVGDAGLIHGFYGLGATIGPLVVAVMPSWRLAVGAAVVVAAGAFAMAVSVVDQWPPTVTSAANRRLSDPSAATPWVAIAVSVLALGAFVAIEVTTGQWAYTYLTDARNVSDTVAAVGVAGFWGGSTVGRLTMAHRGIVRLTDRVGLAGLAGMASVMLLGIVVGPDELSIVFLTLSGLVLAPIVPSLLATTASRVGPQLAARASGWQLAASNLGAIGVPAAVGTLVDSRGPEVIPIVAISVLVCMGLPLLVVVGRLPDQRVLVGAER